MGPAQILSFHTLISLLSHWQNRGRHGPLVALVKISRNLGVVKIAQCDLE